MARGGMLILRSLVVVYTGQEEGLYGMGPTLIEPKSRIRYGGLET
jgi:hypothetical protein